MRPVANSKSDVETHVHPGAGDLFLADRGVAKDGNGVPIPNERASEFSASSSDLTVPSPENNVPIFG